MSAYDDIINRTWDDIPDPKLLPEGDWALSGKRASFIEEDEDNNRSAKVVFTYGVESPVDVDSEALAELGSDYDLELNELTQTVFIDGPAAFKKVRTILGNAGVDLEGVSFLDSLKNFVGAQVIGYVVQRSYQDRQSGETNWVNDVRKIRAAAE